jgi:hypothetical protein
MTAICLLSYSRWFIKKCVPLLSLFFGWLIRRLDILCWVNMRWKKSVIMQNVGICMWQWLRRYEEDGNYHTLMILLIFIVEALTLTTYCYCSCCTFFQNFLGGIREKQFPSRRLLCNFIVHYIYSIISLRGCWYMFFQTRFHIIYVISGLSFYLILLSLERFDSGKDPILIWLSFGKKCRLSFIMSYFL